MILIRKKTKKNYGTQENLFGQVQICDQWHEIVADKVDEKNCRVWGPEYTLWKPSCLVKGDIVGAFGSCRVCHLHTQLLTTEAETPWTTKITTTPSFFLLTVCWLQETQDPRPLNDANVQPSVPGRRLANGQKLTPPQASLWLCRRKLKDLFSRMSLRNQIWRCW